MLRRLRGACILLVGAVMSFAIGVDRSGARIMGGVNRDPENTCGESRFVSVNRVLT